MEELLVTMGLIFQMSGPPLPMQCKLIAVTITHGSPRLGFFCESEIPKEIPDEPVKISI
jgi:hypothetical protein